MLAIQQNYLISPLFQNKKSLVQNVSKQACVAQNPISFTSLKVDNLNSRFNINFTSLAHARLEQSADNYESKIKALENVFPTNPDVAITSPDDIELLQKVFTKYRIGAICSPGGLSINSALSYLEKNGQFELEGPNSAFFIDRMTIENTENLDRLFANDRDVKFFCYVKNDDEARELIKAFNEKVAPFGTSPIIIKRPENPSTIKAPRKEKFMQTFEVLAREKYPDNKEEQEKFIEVMAKYMDEFFTPYSYGSMCQDLRTLHKKIEEEVKKQGKTMDDVIYVYPSDFISFSLVSYLYAMENGISADKFKKLDEVCRTCEEEKILVMVDDVSSSGDTYQTYVEEIEDRSIKLNKSLIYATILGTDFFERRITSEDLIPNTFICAKPLKDFESCTARFPKIKLEYLDSKDVWYVKDNLQRGFKERGCAVTFPYMVPDNCIEVMKALGMFFVNKDTPESNKVFVPASCDYAKVRKELYQTKEADSISEE